MKIHPNRLLSVAVPLLLVFYAMRLFMIDVVPPFIDETFLIDTADTISETSPLFRSEEGRLFASWYVFLAGAPAGNPYFVVRVITVLLVVLGAGAAGSVAYRLGGVAGLMALFILLGSSRYLVFFDAFANIEPMFTGFMMLAVALTLRLRTRANPWDATLTGVAVFITIGTKISALPHLIIPVAGVLALRPAGRRWSANLRWGLIALGTTGILYAGLSAAQVWRGYNPFYHLLASPGGDDLLTLLPTRTSEIWGAFWVYSNPLWLILVGLGVGVLLVRRQFYLLLAVGGAFITVWLTGKYFTRYLYPHVTGLSLIGAVGLGSLLRRRTRLALVVLGLLAATSMVDWLTFAGNLRAAPSTALTQRDYHEHYAADASGTGIDTVLVTLESAGAGRVIGMMSHCKAMAYQAPAPLQVECPRASPSGEDREPLAALARTLAGQNVWVVLENTPYVPQQIPGTIIREVIRPGGVSTLQVIDLSTASPVP